MTKNKITQVALESIEGPNVDSEKKQRKIPRKSKIN